MSFSRWITTRRLLSLEELGSALGEVAPDVQLLDDQSSAERGRISALPWMTFGFALDGATIPALLEISSNVEGAAVRISVSQHDTFAEEEVALGLLAAALHAGGGRYGDDGDHEWSAKKVLTEFTKAARALRERWSGMSAEQRARIIEVCAREP